MDVGAPIEKIDLNIDAKFWFGFISSTIMPSQNESILHHPNAAFLGSIMSRRRIDPGLLISQELALRAKQKLTSLSFLVLITKLCQRARIPRDTTRYIEVTPSFSIDIQSIEVEFTREEVDRRRAVPADISPKVDVYSLQAEAPSPTPASEPSGTSAPSSSSEVPGASSFSQPARITEAMNLKMGQLAYSADVRETRLERSIPGMNDSAILAALTLHRVSVDDLASRVTTCESSYWNISEDSPETSGIPLATTGDVLSGGTTYEESDAETDEELIVVHEEEMMESREQSIFRDFSDLVGMIVQPVIHTSPTETSTTAPNGSSTAIPSEMTPGTDAQAHIATLDTEAPTDGETA
uniref:Putative plant transposon protein domain-containing protein n=1 Tax=Solanum tuberosum TaxID=4113 RepID=M1DHT5_SOLTU